jgi:hypothetical protein
VDVIKGGDGINEAGEISKVNAYMVSQEGFHCIRHFVCAENVAHIHTFYKPTYDL